MTISLHDMFPGARSVWCDCLAPGYAAYARHGEVFGRGGTVFSPGWLAETIESLLIPIGRAVVLRLDRVPHPLRVAVMDFLLDRVRSVALENCGARGRWRSPDAASAVATVSFRAPDTRPSADMSRPFRLSAFLVRHSSRL